ncbi:threonine-phosphate decarboxylase CobD [Halanaerobacter jeridensis]|uniref:threonine-phosphate decarboxylase n=1 Tax=Halanaerobacter jeridensis TaxID=706427 RepID=A0A939BR85_9FIRM|nr:threonine-phosphate decarboxylase [Halanaerobacter jeridensis]
MEQDHGGNITAAAEKYNLNPDEIIDFSANINFLGPPESVLEVLQNNLSAIKNYPDPDCSALKSVLAQQEQLQEENLMIANGAVELIYLVAKVLNPNRTLVLAPTFSEYRKALESMGADVEEFQLTRQNDFKINVEKLLPRLDEVDIFCLCNPNNPTGQFLAREEVMEIIKYAARCDTYILVDEAFVDFLDSEVTVIDLVTEYNNLFVLRSLTKFFAIPGLRLGYGAANQELISKLAASHDPWNVNYFAQLAGEVALKDKKYIDQTKKAIVQEKDFLYQQLNNYSQLKVYYPEINYIFVDLTASEWTASRLEEELGQEGILIRNCNTYSGLGEEFIRLAVKSREENLVLINKLKKLI